MLTRYGSPRAAALGDMALAVVDIIQKQRVYFEQKSLDLSISCRFSILKGRSGIESVSISNTIHDCFSVF
jgi:hypothetical protein